MDTLEQFSHIWQQDKDKYIVLYDEFGKSIFSIEGETLMFCLIDDDCIFNAVVEKMTESGNKIYRSMAELQDDCGLTSGKHI